MRWLVVLVAVGWGAKPSVAPPAVDALPSKPVTRPSGFVATVPRPAVTPELQLPDFHDELRWPLPAMSHPDLSPHYDIAKELAMPGVGWIELCERGVHKRTASGRAHEMLEYLRGWCAAIDRDVDTACTRLTPLLRSDVHALAAAVRNDLPNILADSGDGDRAEHWLARHHITDPRILDALAATFVEVGSTQDVLAINQRAIDTDSYASAETQCRRLVRPLVLGSKSDQIVANAKLDQIISNPKTSNRWCEKLALKVKCWRDPGVACDAYFGVDNSWASLMVLQLYNTWPTRAVDEARWLGIASRARNVLPATGAAELMLAAFEGAITAQGACTSTIAHAVNRAETTMEVVQQTRPEGWAALRTRCAR